MFKLTARCFVLMLTGALNTVFAHHSSSPHYDADQEVLLEGAVITELKLVNPHGYLYFDAPGANGEMSNWRCELRAATVLRRVGWTDETFVPGQVVTIKGNPACCHISSVSCTVTSCILSSVSATTRIARNLFETMLSRTPYT